MTPYVEAHAAEIAAAAARIAGHVRRTPTLPSDLDPLLRLKPENLQRTGSFKARGAFNAVLRWAAGSERGPWAGTGVVTVSSGNHAQAVAAAAAEAGLEAVILVPEGASPAKVAATRALGARVIQEGITFDNRERRVLEVAAELGHHLVHPFDDWDVIHGQATATLELLEDEPDLGMVVAPVGGGGLVSGTALAAASGSSRPLVVGVEPAIADDARRTLESGRLQALERTPDTIADGVRSLAIGARNLEVMVEHGLVDRIVTVDEDEIASATVFAWTRFKLALEPSGALPIAAWLGGHLPDPRGRPFGLVLSGGNFDTGLMAGLLRR